MPEWHEIALPTGDAKQHDFGIHINLKLPEPECEIPATENQIFAVKLFYRADFGDLMFCQAHTLLSCREYARICCEAIFKHMPPDIRKIFARALAAFVLHDDEIIQFCKTWSQKNFNNGVSTPRVRGTPFFADLESFGSYLEGMIEMSGWTKSELKKLRFP